MENTRKVQDMMFETVQRETKTSKKQPHPPKVMVAFLISNY